MIAITTEIVFPVTTFPCLVTVYVDFPRKVETLGCFDNLTLPAIEYITILYCEGNLMPCLIRVLSNSSSHLLALTPSLLVLNAVLSATDAGIRNLALGYQHGPLVTRLEICELYTAETSSGGVAKALNLLAASLTAIPR
ncbi:hypothetical protein CVT25_015466 [Psilocybe cyanescens]|uniref:Uncharacterized protein n=1 Tax=Psilocybe cyanescens TaxID=93625 RepID=A0A409WSA4_PSICY|nr:hypothetical protein CVT25_015466 [Psilocybe cyanescens]